ncbi:hypothetical protein NOCA2150152 [metagenome]|uniref:Uncharacterized protein n=1 Tax=metagenome TaxID=256318 RepID=A0A2P2BXD3_9ZZZZ
MDEPINHINADTALLVGALRAAVKPGVAEVHPGQLQLEVERALGPDDFRRLRREVHQLVAAAQEHLPIRLTRIAPLTPETLNGLSRELAESRGWAVETAQWATRMWAIALGFEQLASSSWQTSEPPGTPSNAAPPDETSTGSAPPKRGSRFLRGRGKGQARRR